MKETKEKQKKEQIQKLTEEYLAQLKAIKGKEFGVLITASDGKNCFTAADGKALNVGIAIAGAFEQEETHEVVQKGLTMSPAFRDYTENLFNEFMKYKKEIDEKRANGKIQGDSSAS